METMLFRLDQLSQRMDRMQNQLDFIEASRAAVGPVAGLDGELGAAPVPGENGFGEPLIGDGGRQIYEMPTGQPRELALAPATGTLGTIPGDAALPAPVGPQGALPLQGGQFPQDPTSADFPPANAGGDPDAEFDAAMTLLTRAQYGQAQEAFRMFSMTYPDTELGAQALYWSADIAYSVDRNYQGAARDFAELLRQYPDAPRAPEGMLKLGMSLLALGQIQEGCVTLAALPRSYPNASASIAGRARAEQRNAACA
jgi:tol-pal system protein YbgF